MTTVQYLMAITFGCCLAAGQILFKIAANQKTLAGDPLPVFSLLFTWPMIAAVALYGMTTILYVVLLQQVPLSRAYLFSMIGSVLVPILAVAIFKEPLSARYIVGGVLVFTGVAIATYSVA